jgi:hypothetical protein
MQKKIVIVCLISMLIGALLGAGVYWTLSEVLPESFAPPDVYLDAIPSTATYVIRNDGTHTYAINWKGKIDFHGEDAGMVINQAINASGTHKIFLKYAIYDIGTPIVAQSNLEIDAEPQAEIRRTTDNNYLLKIESKTNVLIRNLVFNGANVSTSSPTEYHGLIYIKNSSRVTLDNLEVKNQGQIAAGRPPSGIFIVASHDIRVYDSYIHDNQGSGIHVGQETLYGWPYDYDIHIRSNTIIDNTLQYVPGVFGAIVLTNVHNSTIAFNRIRRATWGMKCVGKYAYFKWNTIIGNEIIGSADQSVVDEDGIEIYDEGAAGNKIIGNTLAHWGSDYAFVGSNIQIGEFYLNYTGDGANRNEVSGNTIYLTKKGRGITINGKYNTVTGNTIEKGDADEDAIGIMEAGVSDYNNIMNNDVSTIPQVRYRVFKIGANTVVHYNSGFKTEAQGRASITGPVNGVWVEHGLVWTPRDGFPQVTARQSGQGPYWVGYKNSTHFYIEFTNPPNDGWWSFEWYAQT